MFQIDDRKNSFFCHILQDLFKGKWEFYLPTFGVEADVIFSSKEGTFLLYLKDDFIYRVRGRLKIKDLWLSQIWKKRVQQNMAE